MRQEPFSDAMAQFAEFRYMYGPIDSQELNHWKSMTCLE